MTHPTSPELLRAALHAAMVVVEVERFTELEAYGVAWSERALRYREFGYTRELVAERITAAREAGWTGDEADLWDTARKMSELSGSLPWLPQKAFMERQM